MFTLRGGLILLVCAWLSKRLIVFTLGGGLILLVCVSLPCCVQSLLFRRMAHSVSINKVCGLSKEAYP